ncbi:MAG: HNH endonuclease [Nitrospiraceae bacterium]
MCRAPVIITVVILDYFLYNAPMKTLKERLLEKVSIDPITGCWNWTASTTHGYGQIMTRVNGRSINRKAHHVSYEVFIGQIPEGHETDHVCRNIRCINPYPEHTEPVTPAENQRRRGNAVIVCPEGHPYTPENTYLNPKTGNKACRTCRNSRSRNYFKKNPTYKSDWWNSNLEKNRQKQRDYLNKKRHPM